MGCVYNRGTRARPNFWIKWVGRDGQPRYEKVGSDRELAKAVLAKKEHDLVAKKHGIETEPPPQIPTFADAADAFINRRKALGVDGQPMRRSWKDDRARLNNYLRPRLGRMHLDEITDDHMRRLIDELRAALKPQSIRNCLAIVSRIYNEQPRAMKLENPVALLDRADRDAIGPAWDPKATPWLKAEKVRDVFLAFPALSIATPWRAMFALGTFAGLRTGEVIAAEWRDLDLATHTIHVRRSVSGPLKDDESRIAPIAPALAEVLGDWRRICPVGPENLFPPTGRRGRYVKEHTLGKVLRSALAAVEVPRMKWYEATRHSFASRYVQAGGSLMKLAEILGHSATEVTMRYAHLQPGNFTEAERALVDVQLKPAKVLKLHRRRG